MECRCIFGTHLCRNESWGQSRGWRRTKSWPSLREAHTFSQTRCKSAVCRGIEGALDYSDWKFRARTVHPHEFTEVCGPRCILFLSEKWASVDWRDRCWMTILRTTTLFICPRSPCSISPFIETEGNWVRLRLQRHWWTRRQLDRPLQLLSLQDFAPKDALVLQIISHLNDTLWNTLISV